MTDDTGLFLSIKNRIDKPRIISPVKEAAGDAKARIAPRSRRFGTDPNVNHRPTAMPPKSQKTKKATVMNAK